MLLEIENGLTSVHVVELTVLDLKVLVHSVMVVIGSSLYLGVSLITKPFGMSASVRCTLEVVIQTSKKVSLQILVAFLESACFTTKISVVESYIEHL